MTRGRDLFRGHYDLIPGHCCYNHQQPLSGPRDRGRLEGRTPPSGVAPTVKTSLAGDPVQPGVSPNIWAQGSPSKGGSQHHAPVLLPHRRMGPTTGMKTQLGHPARPHCCTPVLPQAFGAPREANQQPHGEAAALGDGTSLRGADSTGSRDCKELSQPSTETGGLHQRPGWGGRLSPETRTPTSQASDPWKTRVPKGGGRRPGAQSCQHVQGEAGGALALETQPLSGPGGDPRPSGRHQGLPRVDPGTAQLCLGSTTRSTRAVLGSVGPWEPRRRPM